MTEHERLKFYIESFKTARQDIMERNINLYAICQQLDTLIGSMLSYFEEALNLKHPEIVTEPEGRN